MAPLATRFRTSVKKFIRRNSIMSDSSSDEDMRTDATRWMSAERVPSSHPGAEDNGEGGHEEDEEEEHTSYPVLLLACVCLLATMSGLIVSGMHSVVKYMGCPLGINGCHEAPKAFSLIRAVDKWTDGRVPEDIIYIAMAFLGALCLVLLRSRLHPNTRFQISGGGTIQSLMAVARGKPIRFNCAVLRIIVSSIYLGSGGTLGAEGPAIQVCTAMAASSGWAVGMRAPATQSLLSTLGFASGFAASFNSPLAGIIFAMEELGHITAFVSNKIIIVILLASVAATAMSRATHTNFQLFHPEWEPEIIKSSSGGSVDKVFGVDLWMLIAAPIAIVTSFAGWGITAAIARLHRCLADSKFPKWLSLLVGCTLSACIGSACFRITGLRGVWGIGSEAVQSIFDEDCSGWDFLAFAVCKAAAMVITVACRAPGDVLEPILITGGFIGAFCGFLLQLAIGDEELAHLVTKPCVVFGMVGTFSSTFRFPLTPVVITLELMGIETYALVLPTLLCSFTALAASNRLFPKPLLHELLAQDHVNLHVLSEKAVLKELKYEEQLEQTHSCEETSAPNEAAANFTSVMPRRFSITSVLHFESRTNASSAASSASSRRGSTTSSVPSGAPSRTVSLFRNIEQSMLKLAQCVEIPDDALIARRVRKSVESNLSIAEEDECVEDMPGPSRQRLSVTSLASYAPSSSPSIVSGTSHYSGRSANGSLHRNTRRVSLVRSPSTPRAKGLRMGTHFGGALPGGALHEPPILTLPRTTGLDVLLGNISSTNLTIQHEDLAPMPGHNASPPLSPSISPVPIEKAMKPTHVVPPVPPPETLLVMVSSQKASDADAVGDCERLPSNGSELSS